MDIRERNGVEREKRPGISANIPGMQMLSVFDVDVDLAVHALFERDKSLCARDA